MRQFLLFITFVMSINLSRGQQAVIPPSPEASSMGTYANTPVNLFTGIPEITIPLDEVKTNDFRLPINLNYFAKGVQVEQIASNVGLGWSLNAGGVITRSVNLFPDDLSAFVRPYEFYGYLKNNNAEMVYNFDVNQAPWIFFKDFYVTSISPKILDSEPDIFYVNIGGRTTKFIFNRNKEICFLNYNFLKANCTFKTDGTIDYFTVTDENGVIYEFKEKEVTKVTMTNKYLDFISIKFTQANDTYYSFVSSWYLSKITTVKGNEISFTYSNSSITNNLRVQEKADYCEDNCTGESDITSIKQEIQTKNISSITSNNQFIEFIYSTVEREDLPGSKSLNKITTYSLPDMTPIHNLKFNYNYFISKGIETVNDTEKQNYKRLKLESIQQGSGYNVYLPATSFVYNYAESGTNEIRLPNRFSFEQDIWGYYNANGATTLIPKTYIYPGQSEYITAIPKPNNTLESYILLGADRAPDQTGKYTSANILTQIDYPTGGYAQYFYEPNEYFVDGTGTYKGAGLRIKKIETYDGINHSNDNIKQYFYSDSKNYNITSGVVFAMPAFGFISFADKDNLLFDYDNTVANYYHKDASGNYDGRLGIFKDVVKRVSTNMASLGATSNIIGYREVKIIEGIENGYTIYRFNTPGGYYSINDKPDINNMKDNSCDGLYLNTEIHSETYDQINACAAEGSRQKYTYEFFWSYNKYNDYPYPQHPNYDWNRGLLMSKTIYSKYDKPVEELANSYKTFVLNDIDINLSKVFGVKVGGYFLPVKDAYPNNPNCYLNYPPYLYSKYEYFTNCTKLLLSSDLTFYDLKDISKSITKTKTYSYNPSGQISSVTETQSDGTTITRNMKYVSDFSCDALDDCLTAAYDKMKACEQRESSNCATSCGGTSNPNYSSCMNTCLTQNPAYGYCTTTYNYDCSVCNSQFNNQAICLMKEKNMLSNVIETQELKTIGSQTYLTGATLNLYSTSDNMQLPKEIKQVYLSSPGTNTTQVSLNEDLTLNSNSGYKTAVTYDKYDTKGNLLQFHNEGYPNSSYIYGYNLTLPIAEVVNAAYSEIFYSSFEDNNLLIEWWVDPAYRANIVTNTAVSRTGDLSVKVSAGSQPWFSKNFASPDFLANKKYKVTGWLKVETPGSTFTISPKIEIYHKSSSTIDYAVTNVSGNKSEWQYFEMVFTSPSDLKSFALYLDANAASAVYYDDIRVLPTDAKMTTYTYTPLVGMTSSTDNNGFTTFYEYDSFGRLYRVIDHKGNIMKQNEYHYQGQ